MDCACCGCVLAAVEVVGAFVGDGMPLPAGPDRGLPAGDVRAAGTDLAAGGTGAGTLLGEMVAAGAEEESCCCCCCCCAGEGCGAAGLVGETVAAAARVSCVDGLVCAAGGGDRAAGGGVWLRAGERAQLARGGLDGEKRAAERLLHTNAHTGTHARTHARTQGALTLQARARAWSACCVSERVAPTTRGAGKGGGRGD
jgi:hypothetical protein